MRYTAKEEDNYSGDPYHITASYPRRQANRQKCSNTIICKELSVSDILISLCCMPFTHIEHVDFAGETLHFYTSPSLDALPLAQTSPLRGVSTCSLDENALRLHLNYPTTSIDEKGLNDIRLAIIRRRSIVVFALGDRLRQLSKSRFQTELIESE
ncbi:hypothetical protein FRC02_005395 [Tulasnella sp. 418]|nr:hypothetical protein FRC02_005395 [Tulasnella sp. 418]